MIMNEVQGFPTCGCGHLQRQVRVLVASALIPAMKAENLQAIAKLIDTMKPASELSLLSHLAFEELFILSALRHSARYNQDASEIGREHGTIRRMIVNARAGGESMLKLRTFLTAHGQLEEDLMKRITASDGV